MVQVEGDLQLFFKRRRKASRRKEKEKWGSRSLARKEEHEQIAHAFEVGLMPFRAAGTAGAEWQPGRGSGVS